MTSVVTRVSLFALFVSGCAIVNGVDDSASFVTDISARLFKGLQLGADEAEARLLFGEPDAILLGDFAGFIFYYHDGSTTTNPTALEIWFSEDHDSAAVLIEAHSPYSVITKEGIGIGASSSQIASVFGDADETEVRGVWTACAGDIFLGEGNAALCFRYDSTGHVNRITSLLTSTIGSEE